MYQIEKALHKTYLLLYRPGFNHWIWSNPISYCSAPWTMSDPSLMFDLAHMTSGPQPQPPVAQPTWRVCANCKEMPMDIERKCCGQPADSHMVCDVRGGSQSWWKTHKPAVYRVLLFFIIICSSIYLYIFIHVSPFWFGTMFVFYLCFLYIENKCNMSNNLLVVVLWNI